MNSPAEDVARYLVAKGVGAFAGSGRWCVNFAAEPAAPPDDVVTVYDTGGADPDTDELDSRPSFQVRVRCKVYKEGYAKQKEIRDFLLLTAPLLMADSEFTYVNMTSDILSIGRDDANRFLLTANYIGNRTSKITES